MPNEINLLWLLLPVAALSGWLIGQRRINQKGGSSSSSIYPQYFKGLNYVLNEQPDKAIEVFIKMLEVDSETVETHLALGNLFRKRGEVDRAIRIHQNLIARPSLDREQRANASFELGMDYMRSGLLDRAEALFLELIESNLHLNDSCTELLDIYQQEKDWENAIKIARKLEIISGEKFNSIIAQFYCECADSALIDGNMRVAKDSIRQAISTYPKCVRASLIEGKMYQKIGKEKLAIKSYKSIELQDSDFITEIIIPLHDCYRKLGCVDEYIEYLKTLVTIYGGNSSLLMLTELIGEREGQNAAKSFISNELKIKPTVKGVDRLIEYVISKYEGEIYDHLKTVKILTAKLIEVRAMYKCNNCGFDAKQLHWLCLGCNNWNTVKPVLES